MLGALTERSLGSARQFGEIPTSSMGFVPENLVRTGLCAGGREIRTAGPSRRGSAGNVERDPAPEGGRRLFGKAPRLRGGPAVRISLPPAESLRTFGPSAEDAGFISR